MCKKSKKMVGGVLLCIGFLIVAGVLMAILLTFFQEHYKS